jgi:hypothetical protein
MSTNEHEPTTNKTVSSFAEVISDAAEKLKGEGRFFRTSIPDGHASSILALVAPVSGANIIAFNNEQPNEPRFCRVGVIPGAPLRERSEEEAEAFHEQARQILKTGTRIPYERLPDHVEELFRGIQEAQTAA